MNYQQVQEYLYNTLPIFHRQGAQAYKADLNTTIQLMEALGNPQNKFKSIHVAGTNGKGSCSHMLASILKENGMRVGLHTSPHLKDMTERIVINGKPCGKLLFIRFLTEYKDLIEKLKPSYFELLVALCFKYFVGRVDLAVVEVGMGGRLDSTNVIMPEVSLITNISYDHMQFLGDTLPKIASEKAGIIKPNTPVVISQTQDEVKQVFIQKAKEQKAPIYFADEHYKITKDSFVEEFRVFNIQKDGKPYLQNVYCPLLGDYQTKNILGVLQVIDVLNQSGKYHISEADIKQGIMNLQKNFPLHGRWQKLSTNPLTLCDTGHNVDGLSFVLKQLQRMYTQPLHFVFGVVNDKDVDTEIDMLPKQATYYLCKANIPRGLDVNILSQKFKKKNLHYTTYSSVKEAMQAAQKNALKDNGMVFIGGSTYTVAEIV